MQFDNFRIVRRYYRTIRPPRREVLGLFLTTMMGHVPYMFTPLLFGAIVRYIGAGDLPLSVWMLAAYIGLKAFSKLGFWLNFRVMKRYYRAIYSGLHAGLWNKLERMGIGWFTPERRSALLNVANVDCRELAAFSDWLNQFFVHVLSFAVAAVVLCGASPFLVLFGVGVNALIIAILNRCNRGFEKIVLDTKRATDAETGFFAQTLGGMGEVKSFHILRPLAARGRSLNEAYLEQYSRQLSSRRVKEVLVPSLTMLAELVILSYLIWRAFATGMRVDEVIVIQGYFGELFANLQATLASLSALRVVNASLTRYCEAVEGGDAEREGTIQTPVAHGEIRFENVSFAYDSQQVLRNFSAVLRPRQITAIVGPSGSGKSTLFHLLTRLYSPQAGRVLVDGEPVSAFTDEAFSRSVAIVRQDPFLFHMSVYENLALVEPDRRKIVEACKKVRLHDFILSLPQGYDTVLDEDAADLSGGQKQRLAIARALLRGSKILLCDELTSAMDEALSAEIFAMLDELKPDHTIALITHKPSERARADAVIDLGRA